MPEWCFFNLQKPALGVFTINRRVPFMCQERDFFFFLKKGQKLHTACLFQPVIAQSKLVHCRCHIGSNKVKLNYEKVARREE